MDVPFELFVAIRYLLAKRKQAFISLISFISVLGVTVGVMAVLIAMALMTGLQKELRERIVGSSAAALGKGMLTVGPGTDQNAAVTVKGIDPSLEVTVTDIRSSMREG